MRDQLVILAGGQGKRMNSDLPKPLIKIAGKTIIESLLERMRPLLPKPVIIIGYKGELIKNTLGPSYIYAEQKEQKGTADALLASKDALDGVETVAVMHGDHPLVSLETIRELLGLIREKKTVMTLATLKFSDFEKEGKVMARAGRIIRNADGSVNRIVEFKDASEEERKITEINPSYYCFDTKWLWENIGKVKPNNAAKEYYLTDLLGIATMQGHKVYSVEVKNPFEGMGVNTPEELAVVENYLKKA